MKGLCRFAINGIPCAIETTHTADTMMARMFAVSEISDEEHRALLQESLVEYRDIWKKLAKR